MIYDKRNRENISKLAPNTRKAALQWYEYCVKNKIEILIYETIRTLDKQREYMKAGSSQTLRSYHLVGQALDFVPVNSKGDCIWNGYNAPNIKIAVKEAKRIGFSWGGDWTKFVDSPHLEFKYIGYGKDKETANTPVNKPVNNYTSIVDYLKSKKLNSSYAARSLLAAKHGISKYRGTAAQNMELLNILQK